MHRMHKIVLAAAAVVGAATASSANAGSNMNGPQLTGVAQPSAETARPVVTKVTLPADKAADTRRPVPHGRAR